MDMLNPVQKNLQNHFELSPRWVRAFVADACIANSKKAALFYAQPYMPLYYFPVEDVDFSHLTPSADDGEKKYWDIVINGTIRPKAAWQYSTPQGPASEITNYIGLDWHQIDRWMEEDEEIFGGPRSPYHRADALRSSRHVKIVLGGEVVAESSSPILVFETNLPTRYYLPLSDIKVELLPSTLKTICPYKGRAGYYSVKIHDQLYEDIAWYFERPTSAVQQIAGYVCFYDEHVDATYVDGELQEKPQTF